jgi:hypothetical protein
MKTKLFKSHYPCVKILLNIHHEDFDNLNLTYENIIFEKYNFKLLNLLNVRDLKKY